MKAFAIYEADMSLLCRAQAARDAAFERTTTPRGRARQPSNFE